jgi:hypothetical protein
MPNMGVVVLYNRPIYYCFDETGLRIKLANENKHKVQTRALEGKRNYPSSIFRHTIEVNGSM